jgi:hypothetical protein
MWQADVHGETVTTYVYKDMWEALEVIRETTRIRWDPVARNGQREIGHLAQTTRLPPLSFRDLDL